MNLELDNKLVLITGASRGIGRAIALAMAREGADIAVNYRSNDDAAEQTAEDIRDLGRRARLVKADVSDLAAVKEMIAAIKTEGRTVDILVNNAGTLIEKPAAFMSEEEWDRVLDTNLKGAFNCIKVASRDMTRQRCGRIINISSVAGLAGDPMRAGYCAAKAGMLGLTKAMARELAASKVTVNAIAPGIIETDMTAGTPEEKNEKLLARIPLRRFGTPEEVAALATYLASTAAGYITGQVFSIDGGLRM